MKISRVFSLLLGATCCGAAPAASAVFASADATVQVTILGISYYGGAGPDDIVMTTSGDPLAGVRAGVDLDAGGTYTVTEESSHGSLLFDSLSSAGGAEVDLRFDINLSIAAHVSDPASEFADAYAKVSLVEWDPYGPRDDATAYNLYTDFTDISYSTSMLRSLDLSAGQGWAIGLTSIAEVSGVSLLAPVPLPPALGLLLAGLGLFGLAAGRTGRAG